MIGEKFERLLVIKDLGSKDKKKYYECLCDCGNIVETYGIYLRSGNTKSCGCLKRDRIREVKIPNLVGRIFNKLTVIKLTESKNMIKLGGYVYVIVVIIQNYPLVL